jgi:DNA modification methylase
MAKLTWDIRQGDCLKLLPSVAKGSVDLGFADPPFNINYEYDKYQDKKKPEHYLEWCREWIGQMYQAIKPHGTFWVAIGDEFVSELDCIAKEAGFYKRSHVLWYYTFGVNCSKNFARSHTHLLYYVKTKSKFTFNQDSTQLRVASSRQLVYNDSRANPKGKLPDNTWVLSPFDLAKMFTPAEDTWLASRICGTFGERHERGTYGESRGCPQMPLEVMNRIVLACSKPGDLVLDPMSGTGSTGEAAIRNKRSFLGYDISSAYCKRIRERLKRAVSALPPGDKRSTGK